MGASFFRGGRSFSGGFMAGSRLLFGGSFGYTVHDGGAPSSKSVTVESAWRIQRHSGLALCPVARVSRGFRVQVGDRERSSWQLAPGVSVGYQARISQDVSGIPGASFFLVYDRAEVGAGSGDVTTTSRTYGVLSASYDLVFDETYGVAPSVSIPIGLRGGNASFGITLIVGVGS